MRLLLFDFDGVLVDSLALYEASVNRCLERIGHAPLAGREEFLDLFEGNFYDGIAGRGIDVAAFLRASRALTPALDYAAVRPHSEVIPVLRDLKEDRSLAVISSNSAYAISLMFKRFGFDGLFDEVLAADVHLSKIEKIAQAVRRFRAGAAETWYVCDTAGDVLEAQRAGVKTAAVTWGWHSRSRLERARPDRVLDVFEALRDLS